MGFTWENFEIHQVLCVNCDKLTAGTFLTRQQVTINFCFRYEIFSAGIGLKMIKI